MFLWKDAVFVLSIDVQNVDIKIKNTLNFVFTVWFHALSDFDVYQ